jgi:hypothetical protein
MSETEKEYHIRRMLEISKELGKTHLKWARITGAQYGPQYASNYGSNSPKWKKKKKEELEANFKLANQLNKEYLRHFHAVRWD